MMRHKHKSACAPLCLLWHEQQGLALWGLLIGTAIAEKSRPVQICASAAACDLAYLLPRRLAANAVSESCCIIYSMDDRNGQLPGRRRVTMLAAGVFAVIHISTSYTGLLLVFLQDRQPC